MITSEPFAQTDEDVQRVTIDLAVGGPAGPTDAVGYRQTSDAVQGTDSQPDIVLECRYPEGPTIRRMTPPAPITSWNLSIPLVVALHNAIRDSLA